jgi:tetratricopeptide (TPR) repeat protein
MEALGVLALESDPSSENVGALLACRTALWEWRWASAEQQFLEILESDETRAFVHDAYGFFCLAPLGRLDDAETELRRACGLEPANAMAHCHLGRVLHFKRLYAAAADEFLRAIELDPGLALARWGLGEACIQMDEWGAASQAFAAVERLSDLPLALSGSGRLEALRGNEAAAEQALEQLQRSRARHYISPLNLAAVETALGRTDEAIAYVDAAFRERATRLAHLGVDPAFESLKNNGRFLSILINIQNE